MDRTKQCIKGGDIKEDMFNACAIGVIPIMGIRDITWVAKTVTQNATTRFSKYRFIIVLSLCVFARHAQHFSRIFLQR